MRKVISERTFHNNIEFETNDWFETCSVDHDKRLLILITRQLYQKADITNRICVKTVFFNKDLQTYVLMDW